MSWDCLARVFFKGLYSMQRMLITLHRSQIHLCTSALLRKVPYFELSHLWTLYFKDCISMWSALSFLKRNNNNDPASCVWVFPANWYIKNFRGLFLMWLSQHSQIWYTTRILNVVCYSAHTYTSFSSLEPDLHLALWCKLQQWIVEMN